MSPGIIMEEAINKLSKDQYTATKPRNLASRQVVHVLMNVGKNF